MSTKLEEFKPAKGSIKVRKRKGRGNSSGLGGECGRGHKGQRSRSGGKIRPGFEGGQTPLYRRLPKKPGMKNPFRLEYIPVNISDINRVFKDGDAVTPDTLYEKGIIKLNEVYKILGDGQFDLKDLTIITYKISKSALNKLNKLGNKVDLID